MSRLVVLTLAGVMVEAGCGWIWVLSPQLTAIYNPEFTARFFERLPGLRALDDLALGVLGSIGESAPDVGGMVWRLEVGLMLMSLGYVGALRVLGSREGLARGAVLLVVGFALIFRLTLGLLPGLFSTDVFSYVMYGRIAAVYDQNPYVSQPSAFGDDPFLGWVFPFWRDQPTVYGAVWTDFSWVLARLTGSLGNLEQVMAYRLSLGATEALTVGVLGWLLRRIKPRGITTALAVYAWNPLVLFDLVGSAHNDAAMLALLLIGVALIPMRPRAGWLAGLLAMTLSALVKYTTGVAVLLWAVAWAAQGATIRRRLVRLGAGIGLPLALAIVVWWPWVQTSAALLPLGEAAGGRLVLNSAPDLVALTVADQLLSPAGMPPDAAQAAARFWMRAITRGLFAVYLAWEAWRLWTVASHDPERMDATLRASTRVLLVLPLLVMTWVWSWYFSWSLALAALLGWRSTLARLVVAYSLVVLPVIYAHLYLNDQMSGLFVVAFAVGPLLLLIYSGIHRPTAQPQPVPAGER